MLRPSLRRVARTSSCNLVARASSPSFNSSSASCQPAPPRRRGPRKAHLTATESPRRFATMATRELKAEDIYPLIEKLTPEEQARLAYYALRVRAGLTRRTTAARWDLGRLGAEEHAEDA